MSFEVRRVLLPGLCLFVAGLALGIGWKNVLNPSERQTTASNVARPARTSVPDAKTPQAPSRPGLDETGWRELRDLVSKSREGEPIFSTASQLALLVAELRQDELARALELVPRASGGDFRRFFAALLWDRWPVRDRDQALSLASLLADSRSPSSVLSTLLDIRSESDWEGAARWVRRVQDPGLRRRCAEVVLGSLAGRDPERAMEWSTTFDLQSGADGIREFLFRRWIGANPEPALAWLIRPDDASNQREASRLLAIAADLERELPLAAAGKVAALPFSGQTTEAPASVKAWTKTDGPGAWAWTQTIAYFKWRENAQIAVMFGWADSDLAGALKWASGKLPFDREMLQLATAFGTLLGRKDFDAAVNWAEGVQDPKDRRTILGRLVKDLAERSPRAAADWLAKQTDPELVRNGVANVLRHWTKSDPALAATWVASFPDGAMRDDALGRVAKQWTFDNPDGAAEWIEALPPGSGRDQAISGYVESIDGSRPDLAAHWALEIEAPGERERRVFNAASRWIEKDRAAAYAWIEQAEIPDEIKARLLPRPR